jgi:hypothetical protein
MEKSGATIGDALTSIPEVIKSLGIEILKSEKETTLGRINLFLSLFVFIIFLVQSFKTIFAIDMYELMFLFCALFIFSVMIANRSLRSKEVDKLRRSFDER